MAETDIRLSIDLEVGDAEQTAENLQKEIKRIFDDNKGQQSAAFTNLEVQMKQTSRQAQDLREQMHELARDVPTQEYAELTRQIEEAEQRFADLENKIRSSEGSATHIRQQLDAEQALRDRMIEKNLKTTTDKEGLLGQAGKRITYKALDEDIGRLLALNKSYEGVRFEQEQVGNELDRLYAAQQRLEEQGLDIVIGRETQAYQQAVNQLDALTDRQKQQIIHYEEMTQRAEQMADRERQREEQEHIARQERLAAHQQEMQLAEKQWQMAQEQQELEARITEQHRQQRAEAQAAKEQAQQVKQAQQEARMETIAANSSLMALNMSVRSIGRIIPGVKTTALTGVVMLTRALIRLSNITKEQLVAAIGKVKDAVAKLFKFIMANPIVLVVAAIVAAIVALIKKLKELWDETEEEVKELFESLADGLTKLGELSAEFIGTLTKGFFKLGNILPSTLFSIVSFLISKIKSLSSMIKENLDLMAKWNNGNNEINKSLSNITSSLAYLKASITAAIAPVITYVEPALTRLIDLLAKVFEVIGMIIAKLTGATTFQKAIRKQKDYAESLKETNGQLASFDKLNVLNSNNNAAADFGLIELKDVELPDWLENLEELGRKLGRTLKKFLKGINWDTIKAKAAELGTNIAKFINGFFEIPDLGSTIGKTLGEGLNTITTLINNFLNEFDGKKLGLQIGAALETMITTIHWDEIGSIFSGSLNKFVEILNGFFTEFKGEDAGIAFTTFLQNALGKINWNGPDGIKATISLIAEDIAGFFNEVLTPENFGLVGTTLGETLNTILTGVDVFVHKADWEQWGDGVAEGIMKFIRTTDFEKFGEDVGNLILGLLKMIKTAITKLSDPVNRKEIVDAIVDFFKNVPWVEIAREAKTIGASIRDGLKSAWEELKKNGAYDDIIYFIVEFLEEKKNWDDLFADFQADVVGDIFWKKVERVFTRVAQHIESALETIWNFIVDVATNIGSFFDDFVFGDASFEDWLNGKAPKQLAAKGLKMNQGTLTGAELSKVPLAEKKNRMVRGGTVPTAADLYAGGKISISDTSNLPLSTEAAIEQAVGKAIKDTEIKVTFDVKGDPNGIFKVTQNQAQIYYNQTGNLAFVPD